MRKLALLLVMAAALQSSAWAQSKGFAVERYEPTGAGQWSFMVDHPWYTRSRWFAAVGLTLDYAHDPLVFGSRDASGNVTPSTEVIEHQLTMHVDAAFSFLDRISLAVSLPVVLFEAGTPAAGVAPLSGGAVGDPRVGGMVRIFGQPLRDAFSIHAGFDLWIPIGADDNHAGDGSVRFMPKLVLGGLSHHILWSFLGAFEYRPVASISDLPAGAGDTVGSELKLGAAVAYADVARRFAIGPELLAATVLTGPAAGERTSSSIELLLGGHYNIAGQVETGLAVGLGLLTEPGTPDLRVIFRIAYAPMRPEPLRLEPPDALVRPVVPEPPADRDHDGIADAADRCPDLADGAHPDAARPGCPQKDSDGDGVFDGDDLCIDVVAGPHPSTARAGCPDTDADGDGLFDSSDACPDVAAGLHPDPARVGCPLPDGDHDGVPDGADACPDQPGAPSRDPKKNGCPGLVEIKNGQLVILKPVFFATNRDVILPKSFPVLQAVAEALAAEAQIEHLSIEGHTDDHGSAAKNLDLSERRAQSVLRFLVEHGVSGARLEAHGYGSTRPIASNKTAAGRATNRRVEFRIVTAPAAPASATP